MEAIFAGCLACILGTGHAFAQELQLSPIVIDIEGVGDEDLLVIAAYKPLEQPAIVGGGRAERSALRVRQGRPQPSIILGRVEPGAEEEFGIEVLLPATVEEFAFPWDDLETRASLRVDDPDLFQKLVEGGHIDPPEGELNAALQTDLQRMNCYRSSIDGLWGNRSRRSVREYFDTLDNGASWPDQEPSNGLFRTIVINGDVRCVVAVATTPRPSTTTRTTTTRTTSSSSSSSSTPPTNVPSVGVFR